MYYKILCNVSSTLLGIKPVNKEKIDNPDMKLGKESLLNNKYLLVQKGKKNYFMICAV